MAGRRTLTKLRPLREGDLAGLARWLPQTAADLGCPRWASEERLRDAVDEQGVLVAVEGEPVAFVAYETSAPKRSSARVRLLAVAPGQRRLGIGGRAALALEKRLAGSSKRLYVLVPANAGLTFYFWLRLGYRPLTQREWPAAPEEPPAAWMVRSLG